MSAGVWDEDDSGAIKKEAFLADGASGGVGSGTSEVEVALADVVSGEEVSLANVVSGEEVSLAGVASERGGVLGRRRETRRRCP